MPRQNSNVDVRIGGRTCKVRKRGGSSSSSSLVQKNYRLKRAFLVGKRVGSSTPVPKWKMMGSKSPPLDDNDKASSSKYMASKDIQNAENHSVSARKLAATLWEINGLASPRLKRENLEDRMSVVRKEKILEPSKLAICLSDLFHNPVYEKMDYTPKMGSNGRRGSVGSQKLVQDDSKPGSARSHLLENPVRSPFDGISGAKNRLKEVYNSLVTCKELLKVMSRVWHVEQQNSSTSSLVLALKLELDRSCIQVEKLIQEQRTKRSEIDILFRQFEEEKMVWKIKEQDRIRSSIAGELEFEKKLRRQTERLNKKLSGELADTKASLSKATKELGNEKRTREILEQAYDELARGIGEDRAEVEELKRQSANVREEVEKEREMLQLADALREERVQMKLSEAKYQFEEKNALVDKLKNELEAYLKSKKGDEQGDGSPSYDKIKELQNYLRETLPVQGKETEDIEAGNKDDEEEKDDSADSDLHSIELNMYDISKSFHLSDLMKNEPKRDSVDKRRGRESSLPEKIKHPTKNTGTNFTDGIQCEFAATKQENGAVFDRNGLFDFESSSRSKDVEDEIERYNMIKTLRDHIVSGSRIASSQDLASPSHNLEQQSAPSKDPNGVVCPG